MSLRTEMVQLEKLEYFKVKHSILYCTDFRTTLCKLWTQSYDRELQRQRCKFLQRYG
jgi:hypothetical protein